MNLQQPRVESFLSKRIRIISARKPLNVVMLLGRPLSLMQATGNQSLQLHGRRYRMRRGHSGKKRLGLLIWLRIWVVMCMSKSLIFVCIPLISFMSLKESTEPRVQHIQHTSQYYGAKTTSSWVRSLPCSLCISRFK
jgi:hypothetical protein